MLIFVSVLLLFATAVYQYIHQPKFGRIPSGDRLARIKKSPNYKNGAFRNLSHTPDLTEGVTYYSVIKEFFFDKKQRLSPKNPLPSIKTDLLHLELNQDVLVWFGHSSYFIQIDGKRILVDPVFSGSASPLPFGTKAFEGSDIYAAKDIPEIDFLFITHDHWDHLDFETITKLKPKVKCVICGLGTGAHLEYWGFDKNKIIERDWNEYIKLDDNFSVNTVPARHFSGRGIKRNKALWMSFVLQTPNMKIFIGGDSGYDSHFSEIGKSFGPFDLAILENGQYDRKWRYIHLMPDEILQAAMELRASTIFPVHSSKFVLGTHGWDEPLSMISANAMTENLRVITPKIGEPVSIRDKSQHFEKWWEGVD